MCTTTANQCHDSPVLCILASNIQIVLSIEIQVEISPACFVMNTYKFVDTGCVFPNLVYKENMVEDLYLKITTWPVILQARKANTISQQH